MSASDGHGGNAGARRHLDVLFEAIIDHVPIMLFLKNAERLEFELWNRAATELVGLAGEEVIGKTDFDFFPPEQAQFFQAKDREVLAKGKLLEVEEPVQTKQGERWLLTKKIPLRDADGKPLYLLGVSQDITERRRAREALERAKLDAEAGSRAKSEFLANVSHELRTPLTLVLGPLDSLLQNPDLAHGARTTLRRVYRNAARLHGLVDDLLDFAKAEANKLEPVLETIDLAPVMRELVDDLADAASARELAISFEYAARDAAPAIAEVDRDLFDRIVLNLVSNALKFTPKGGEITLGLRSAGDHVEVDVRDTGIGIAADKLDVVFRRFEQADAGPSRRYGGTGIGLALVHELVKVHGGDVGVESDVGRGSRFWLRLPRSPSAVLDSSPHRRSSRPPARAAVTFAEMPRATTPVGGAALPSALPKLVLAEDNPDMRDYVTSVLSDEFEVIATADGVEALEAIGRHRPSVVVSDVMMPRLDGLGLVRRLKADTELQHIPVILLTAQAGREALVTGLDVGADDYVAKPFSQAELRARARAALRLSEAHATLASTADELRIALDSLRASSQWIEAAVTSAEPPPANDSTLRGIVDHLEQLRARLAKR